MRAFGTSFFLTNNCDGPVNKLRCGMLSSEETNDAIPWFFNNPAASSASALVLKVVMRTNFCMKFSKISYNVSGNMKFTRNKLECKFG